MLIENQVFVHKIVTSKLKALVCSPSGKISPLKKKKRGEHKVFLNQFVKLELLENVFFCNVKPWGFGVCHSTSLAFSLHFVLPIEKQVCKPHIKYWSWWMIYVIHMNWCFGCTGDRYFFTYFSSGLGLWSRRSSHREELLWGNCPSLFERIVCFTTKLFLEQ